MELANEVHMEENNIIPALQGSPVDYLVDEIPLDQLVAPGDEGFPEEEAPEQMQHDNGPDNKIQAQMGENQEVPEEPEAQGGGNQVVPEENEILEAMVADDFQQIQLQSQNSNVQLGYALMRIEERDLAWSQAMNAEATRLWARFFSSGNASNIHINILADWANFL